MNSQFPSADAAWQLAGWTMLHFLWVGAAMALAGAAMRFACRRAAPNVRYAVSLATFVLLAAAPIGIAAWLAGKPEMWTDSTKETFSFASAAADAATWGSFSGTPESVGLRDLQHAGDVREPIVDAAVGNPSPGPSLRGRGMDAPLARLVAWLPVAWLVGAPITFAMLAAGLVGSRRLRRAGATLADGPIAEACVRLRRVLGVGRRVSLAVCDGLAQPVLVGIVKPTILLPAAALAGWSPQELEMVLLHELAHVRRWDNLVNLGQRLVESLLFFHPAVWLASRQVRRDREECCDAIVVAHSGRPEAYASLLVSVAASLRNIRGSSLVAASALANQALASRVRRILKLEDEPMWISRRMLALLVVLSLVLSTAAYRAFAVPAPIKRIPEESQTSEGVPGASPAADENVLIKKVYPINDADFVNFRAWMKLIGSRKDIEIRWHDDSNGLIIAAPQSVHDQISDFLEHSRESQKFNAKLNSELQSLKTQLEQMDVELNDIEVMKELAIQSARSPVMVDAAVNDALDKDPTIRMSQEQLFTLSQQLQQLQASTRNPQKAKLQELQTQHAQVQQQMEQYRATAEKELRDRLAKIPNESLRSAIAEYTVRKEYLNKKKAELEAKIKADEDHIAEKAVGAEATETVSDDSTELGMPAFHDDNSGVVEGSSSVGGHLTVSKEGPRQGFVGQKVRFRVTIRNDGNLPLTDIRVQDEYPPALLRIKPPADPQIQIARGVIARTIPRLEIGEQQAYDVECTCIQPGRPVIPSPLVRVAATTDPPTRRIESLDDHWIEIRPAHADTAIRPNETGADAPVVELLRMPELLAPSSDAERTTDEIEESHADDHDNDEFPRGEKGPKSFKPAYRYNGKTLEQWREDSRYELMIGRRIDAINAFAVFGQSAMPREAAEAIFDLAGEYDLADADSPDLKAFRSAVIKGLRAENGAGIPSATWLPILADRYASDEAKWKPLTLFLLSQLTIDDKAPSAVLEKLEASDDEEIRAAAKEAREGRARPPRPQGGEQIESDPPRNPTGWQQPAPDRYGDERRR